MLIIIIIITTVVSLNFYRVSCVAVSIVFFFTSWHDVYAFVIHHIVVFVGFVAVNDGDNYDSSQRALLQVVYQLRHLVNVWRNILPAHIYAKSVGEWIDVVVCLCVVEVRQCFQTSVLTNSGPT